jgi:hypothetical protein
MKTGKVVSAKLPIDHVRKGIDMRSKGHLSWLTASTVFARTVRWNLSVRTGWETRHSCGPSTGVHLC